MGCAQGKGQADVRRVYLIDDQPIGKGSMGVVYRCVRKLPGEADLVITIESLPVSLGQSTPPPLPTGL